MLLGLSVGSGAGRRTLSVFSSGEVRCGLLLVLALRRGSELCRFSLQGEARCGTCLLTQMATRFGLGSQCDWRRLGLILVVGWLMAGAHVRNLAGLGD